MPARKRYLTTLITASSVLVFGAATAGTALGDSSAASGRGQAEQTKAARVYDSGYQVCDTGERVVVVAGGVGHHMRVRWGPAVNTSYTHKRTRNLFYQGVPYTQMAFKTHRQSARYDVRIKGQDVRDDGPRFISGSPSARCE